MCLFRIAHLLTRGCDSSEHVSGTTNQTHHWTNNGCITYGSESESPGSVILNVNLGKSLNLSQYLFFIYKSGVNDPCLKGFWWWIIEIIYFLVSNFSASFIACNEDDENRFSQCFRVTEFLKAWSMGAVHLKAQSPKMGMETTTVAGPVALISMLPFSWCLRGRVGNGAFAGISCWRCHRWLWRVGTQKGNKNLVPRGRKG